MEEYIFYCHGCFLFFSFFFFFFFFNRLAVGKVKHQRLEMIINFTRKSSYTLKYLKPQNNGLCFPTYVGMPFPFPCQLCQGCVPCLVGTLAILEECLSVLFLSSRILL